MPSKYFELYDGKDISLARNQHVPQNFLEENWHYNGNIEIEKFENDVAPFNASVFGFDTPVDNQTARELRHGYFAATSFIDAQVGRVIDALDANGYAESTIVALWSDHGYTCSLLFVLQRTVGLPS